MLQIGKNNQKKTHETFLIEVRKLHNDEYDVIDKYVNAKTKIRFIHNKCGNEFEMTPSNFLNGQECPHCKGERLSKIMLKTTQDFKKEVYDLVGREYSVISEYMGRNHKILLRHNVCGYEFYMTPSKFINCNERCPNKKCLHKRLSNSMRDDVNTFENKFNKRSCGEYELLSKYDLSYKKIKIKHLLCGHIFEMTAGNFIQGQGCPNCNISKPESKIRNILLKNNIPYIWQKSFSDLVGVNGGKLSYDFYLPDYNLLLEYQGQYHDGKLVGKCQSKKKFKIQQEHDIRKREYAKSHNIGLLEIWYWDFDNIEEILVQELKINTTNNLNKGEVA